jgi:hypothetical protein
MSELQTKFDTLIENQIELKKKFQAEAQSLFKDITKEFFDKNPGINAVRWTQYTPYFNDGDTCEFNVNEPVFTNASEEELENVSAWGEYEGEDETVWALESYVLTGTSKWHEESREKVSNVDIDSCHMFAKMINSNEMEDVMLAMFGDHVVVTATRDGFDVTDYDHD